MKKELFDGYISRMTEIRLLSSPELKGFDDADGYSRRLRDNFKKIGNLALENREMLDEVLFPFVDSTVPLTEEEIRYVREINENLVDYQAVENLDSAIMSLLSNRLMQDAEKKEDEDYLIAQLHEHVIVCHTFMYMTSRISTNPAISGHFREQGLAAAKRLLSYLDHDRFRELSPESRDHVLMTARFHATLYGSASGISAETAHEWVRALDIAMGVYEDPFYKECFPEYNWDYFLYRTLEYYSSILDYTYRETLFPEDLAEIIPRVKAQEALWQTDPEKYDSYTIRPMLLISLYQVMYLSGEIKEENYREKLMELYRERDPEAYDFDNLFVNIRCGLDQILSMDRYKSRECEKAFIGQFYNDALGYAFRMPNSGTLSEFLELYTPVLSNFVEVPGKITFEEMGLRSLAALHPPTFVHSRMVALLSRCMAAHLLDEKPELFIGVLGTKNADEVSGKRDEIISLTYHAALCHDFGKLPILDTVFIYGRRLLDFEFDIIRQHPELGAALLSPHESTKAYAEVALGHHKWYNNSGGYPENYDTEKSSVKTIIDIVACADCMDAATDSIGRSYNQGKSLSDFEKELQEGSGARYAPYLPTLLEKQEVREDLEFLLTEGRQMNYRNTFLLLREVQEMAE